MKNYERLNADIVVVGGGIAGMVAAIRAKELLPAGKVLVIDKGKASRSGCANWAGGDITFTLPDDNIPELVNRYMLSGDGLADPDWIHFALIETYPRVLDMVRYGVLFERDSTGNLLRKGGRGGGALSVISQGAAILKGLRQAAEKIGVVFVDKTMVTDIIGDKEGIANGVLGFKVGTEKVIPSVLTGKAIILLTGPVSFKAAYIGHRMCTGEGLAMAYRHGAEFMGMELASGHNAGPRSFDLSGMARFVAMGGRFLNAKDEEFMARYDPVLKNQANWNTLNLAMAVEIQEGRGPIYFDLTAMRPEDIELSKKILPHTFLALEREEIKARDSHELMKAHEAKSMVTTALMILKASLLREESRGTHHRVDFPQRDDLHWKRWLYLKKAEERTEFWTETKDGAKNLLGEF